jgi:hypothetical protein
MIRLSFMGYINQLCVPPLVSKTIEWLADLTVRLADRAMPTAAPNLPAKQVLTIYLGNVADLISGTGNLETADRVKLRFKRWYPAPAREIRR